MKNNFRFILSEQKHIKMTFFCREFKITPDQSLRKNQRFSVFSKQAFCYIKIILT